MHTHRALRRHRHFRDLGKKRVTELPQRDPARPASRRRRAPPRALGREVEHLDEPRVARHELSTKRVRILPRGVRQLVHEALDHPAVLRRPHAAPRRDGNAGVLDHPLQTEMGHRIDQLIRPAREQERSALGAHQAMAPRHRRPARVEPAAQHVIGGGTIQRVLNVVFPRPHDLDRAVDVLRQLHRLGRIVHGPAAPAEAAAQIRHVNGDRLGREARQLRRRLLDALRVLRGRPDLAPLATHVRGAVHRLHAGVREIGRLVHCLDGPRGALERRVDVAHRAHHLAPRGALRRGGEGAPDAVTAPLRDLALVPLDLQRLFPLERGPRAIGHDRHAARDLHYA